MSGCTYGMRLGKSGIRKYRDRTKVTDIAGATLCVSYEPGARVTRLDICIVHSFRIEKVDTNCNTIGLPMI